MPFSGEKLRELRTASGLSREQLAERSGTTKQYISHLENGVKANPAFDLVEKLAAVLGTDCRSFADAERGGAGSPQPTADVDGRPFGKGK
jgi:transcriptional regulator with XRE-family HTH domain